MRLYTTSFAIRCHLWVRRYNLLCLLVVVLLIGESAGPKTLLEQTCEFSHVGNVHRNLLFLISVGHRKVKPMCISICIWIRSEEALVIVLFVRRLHHHIQVSTFKFRIEWETGIDQNRVHSLKFSIILSSSEFKKFLKCPFVLVITHFVVWRECESIGVALICY